MVMVMVVLTMWLVMYLCVFLVEATGDYIWSKRLYDSRYMLTSRSMNADSVVASSLRLCPRGFLHRLRMGCFSRHRVLFFRRFILPGHVVQKIVVSVIESLDLGSRVFTASCLHSFAMELVNTTDMDLVLILVFLLSQYLH